MSKYASYYAPINRALENFNAQINENARRKMAAEHNLAQQQLATSKFMYEQTDPVRVLAQQQATERLAPTKINLSRNMPADGSDRATLERWTSFKPNIGNIVGDPKAELQPDGTLMGGDGRPIVQPKWKAQQIQNRIAAAQMFEFDEEAQRQSELRSMAGDIEKEQAQYNKTKSPQLQMKIKGMQEQLSAKTKEYENPNRQLMSLSSKMNKIDRYLADAYASGNPDKGWVETLKWQSARAQKQYNALLKAMGKEGKAEGIQLKRYRNPTTGEVIEYPVSKYEGAEYSKTNPVAGGKRHMGTFVLENESVKPSSPQEQYNMVEGYISDYERRGREITALKSALVKGSNAESIIKSMNITDPDIIAMISQATVDKEATQKQIGDLESTRQQLKTNMFKMFKDDDVQKRLKSYFGEQLDDPLGLTTGTSVGEKYKGTNIPPELITP